MSVFDMVVNAEAAKHSHRNRAAALAKTTAFVQLKRERPRIRVKAREVDVFEVVLNGRLYAVAETKCKAKVIAARLAQKMARKPTPTKRMARSIFVTEGSTMSPVQEARRLALENI
jgi:hypothetical protein